MTSEERREARYQRRKARRRERLEARNRAVGSIEEVFSFRNMFRYGKECCNGVRWKQSAQNFERHLLSGTARRRRQVLDGRWVPKRGVHFVVKERGHLRPIDAPHIEDRQIEKTFTREVLVPLYGPSMIYDNGASQRGKGLHFHYERMKQFLREQYRETGRSGAVFLGDYHRFFPDAPHQPLYDRHSRYILDWKLRRIADAMVAETGEKGMHLGKEPSQQEMVALPSAVDNHLKCQMGLRHAGHYMDDYGCVLESEERAREVEKVFTERSERMGLQVNRGKCHVVRMDKSFRFCKAKFMVTETGRVVTHGCRDGMKRARRKLRLFRRQVEQGQKTVRGVELWLDGPLAYYSYFNDHGRVLKLKRMFYAMFLKEESKCCTKS